eukprot:CAMPEP_0114582898 /NCGR_PEP_ID=MMETSP0125-20121206/6758_1 /TAXON_ID=485358 ORGANISM="Aristerostoma sp., Strain ATCC 50986" /NCGR_SAMPLE_ID=MMETSP0125 /ASSEMBLY_ACC=CAM_ASM_000245 /LENGTH=57 /DNA_ID=CAMNT_0001776069 /DNA_START=464 /DNA_END=637 /DNA_ORIENTATION=+
MALKTTKTDRTKKRGTIMLPLPKPSEQKVASMNDFFDNEDPFADETPGGDTPGQPVS